MRFILPVLPVLLLGCTQTPPPPPPPRPVAVVTPAPKPLPAPAAPALAANWQDWPLTPGDWAYRRDARGSVALFGPVNGDALFLARCDVSAKRIFLSRAGRLAAGNSATMTIRTTSSLKSYAVQNNGDAPPYVAAALPVSDPQLDAMAFSRGRFIISVNGAADVVIPNWPELARVIEDCRG
jgi:hypothetical protein